MFTGIIEELGKVEACQNGRLSISCQRVMSDLTLGASIAVNGVCLTAVELRPDGFSSDLAEETLDRTNLSDLHPGDLVNLERPLMLQTRLSGHIVQGHVDGTGVIESWFSDQKQGSELVVRVPEDLDRFLVYKGSICLDGISLTIAKIQNGLLTVAIIPHTKEATNLLTRKPGDRINIECDILAKHVDRLLAANVQSRSAWHE